MRYALRGFQMPQLKPRRLSVTLLIALTPIEPHFDNGLVSHDLNVKDYAMIRLISISLASATLLGGCATINGRVATSKERAACVEMEKDMGLQTTHDHAEMKGMGRNPMNMTHDRCMQILAQPG